MRRYRNSQRTASFWVDTFVIGNFCRSEFVSISDFRWCLGELDAHNLPLHRGRSASFWHKRRFSGDVWTFRVCVFFMTSNYCFLVKLVLWMDIVSIQIPSKWFKMTSNGAPELSLVGSFPTNEATKSFVYHPTLNVIFLITKDSNIRVIDLHSGQTLHVAESPANGKWIL